MPEALPVALVVRACVGTSGASARRVRSVLYQILKVIASAAVDGDFGDFVKQEAREALDGPCVAIMYRA